jgi:hypothetical protein
MFYGSMKESNDDDKITCVDITSVSLNVFTQVLSYLYTGQCELTPQNTLDVYYFAGM